MENRRLLAEEAAAEDASEQLAAPSDEAEFAALGVSMRWDEQLQRLQAGRLDAIDRALGEMAGARYGVCARCRGVIAIDRLRHSPDTRVCGECAGRSLTVS